MELHLHKDNKLERILNNNLYKVRYKQSRLQLVSFPKMKTSPLINGKIIKCSQVETHLLRISIRPLMTGEAKVEQVFQTRLKVLELIMAQIELL